MIAERARRARAWAVAAATAVGSLAAPSVANAATCPAGLGPRNAVAIRPLLLFERGFGAEYERYLTVPVSIAVGGLVRAGGGEDFSGLTLGAAMEGRFWLYARASAPTCLGTRSMAGPFASLRIDAARTHLSEGDRGIGTAFDLAETLGLGWRVMFEHFAVSPSVGIVTTSDFAPRFAATTRASLSMGLTLGWLF
jgi:hypothetical protein